MARFFALPPLTKPIVLPSYTVATLPPAAAFKNGRAMVMDARASAFYSPVVGGGPYSLPVFSDGIAWRVG